MGISSLFSRHFLLLLGEWRQWWHLFFRGWFATWLYIRPRLYPRCRSQWCNVHLSLTFIFWFLFFRWVKIKITSSSLKNGWFVAPMTKREASKRFCDELYVPTGRGLFFRGGFFYSKKVEERGFWILIIAVLGLKIPFIWIQNSIRQINQYNYSGK